MLVLLALAVTAMITSASAYPPRHPPERSIAERQVPLNNLPQVSPTCTYVNSTWPTAKTYSNTIVQDAIIAGSQAIDLNRRVGTGNNPYPQRRTPGTGATGPLPKHSWADYDLPGCAQAATDPKAPGFFEWPILRNDTIYNPDITDQGPDRVFFQYVTDGNPSTTYPAARGLVGNLCKLIILTPQLWCLLPSGKVIWCSEGGKLVCYECQ